MTELDDVLTRLKNEGVLSDTHVELPSNRSVESTLYNVKLTRGLSIELVASIKSALTVIVLLPHYTLDDVKLSDLDDLLVALNEGDFTQQINYTIIRRTPYAVLKIGGGRWTVNSWPLEPNYSLELL